MLEGPVIALDCERVSRHNLSDRTFDVLSLRVTPAAVGFTAAIADRNRPLCAAGLALYGPGGVLYGAANWKWRHRPAIVGDSVRVRITLTAAGRRTERAHGRALVRERRRYATGGTACRRPPTASLATWRIVL